MENKFLEDNTMNKTELVSAVAEKAGLQKKDAEKAVAAVFSAVEDALKAGDKVQLIGFGTFEVKERAARTGHNPKTGESMEIAACKVPSFKAGAALKNAVK
ncbi:MAG: HU family DNA-binding protein [Acutalibacteraceae bacterium]